MNTVLEYTLQKWLVCRRNKSTVDIKQRKKEKQDGFQSAINSQQPVDDGMQLSFFQLNDPVLENIKDELQKTDINTLTPVEALMKLNEIKKMIGG
mgnify:CR=1 FL=1